MLDLTAFGITSDDLSQQGSLYPKKVPGRVAHIDADFISYQIAAITNDEKNGIRPLRTLQFKLEQVQDIAQDLAERAGAEKFVLHITPSGSDKGGRREQAVQKEYQGNRKDKEKPEDLDVIRNYIGTHSFTNGYGAVHLDQEADDGMAQANYSDPKNSVILSRDKDLRMVPGKHFDWDTGEIIEVPQGDFGSIELVQKGSAKKLLGYGPKFFWAQCLMGDTADNVQGLPSIFKEGGKPKKCGPAAAFSLLENVQNSKDAFYLVRSLFTGLETYHEYQYLHWNTAEAVSPTRALLGDMQLLWMRRNPSPDDVVEWLREQVQ